MPVQQIGDDGLIELEAYRESALSAAFVRYSSTTPGSTAVRRRSLPEALAAARSLGCSRFPGAHQRDMAGRADTSRPGLGQRVHA
jgi:hypothetical protein